MIIDTSGILPVLFAEPSAIWISQQLHGDSEYQMSMVNLTECLIQLRDRKPADADRLINRLYSMNIAFVPPDLAQAKLAASVRLRYPLNFGDCFAYALAKTRKLPLLTLDSDFRATDITVLLPPA